MYKHIYCQFQAIISGLIMVISTLTLDSLFFLYFEAKVNLNCNNFGMGKTYFTNFARLCNTKYQQLKK